MAVRFILHPDCKERRIVFAIEQASWNYAEKHLVYAPENQDCGSIKLSCTVEIDEAYIGGKESNKHESKKLNQGRGSVGKTAVMGIKERSGKVVAQVVENADKATAESVIEQNVASDATVNTDESSIYNGVSAKRKHVKVNHSAKVFVDGMASTNGIESVWAVLKPGFPSTHNEECHCGGMTSNAA